MESKYISESKKNALQKNDLIGRLRRMKENVGFIVNRVTAIQAGLDSWQSEQINRKLYYLSFLSIIFLPLSIVTGVFGMNVGGVPWTGQNAPELKDGFRNVILLCGSEKKLVTEQEVIAEEIIENGRSRQRGLSADLMLHVIDYFIYE
ncbi:hypothetical protein V8G54_032926 [Vigna mungo]|uniref:Uncharacterized protein n=1 Tax=Vigna mungo TaxID=3915 RepID=A0AAQ3RID9_VIGMU